MSITELILVASLVINVFTILLTFIIFHTLMSLKPQIQQIHSGLSTTLAKLFSIEHILDKMGNGFTEFIKLTENMMDYTQGPTGKIVYKTTDGKYTAKSIDELVEKIKDAGEADEYFSDEELDKLKKLFDEDDDTFDEDEQD